MPCLRPCFHVSDEKKTKKYREYLGSALVILGQQVENTIYEIQQCRRTSGPTKEDPANWQESRTWGVAVFHPTDSALNLILIAGHVIKTTAIYVCMSLALYVGKEGPYPDEELPYLYRRPSYFNMLYAGLLSLSYLCVIIEIVMKLFTGYLEKGRTIMDARMIRDHYKKKRSLMVLDIFSLIPTPYLYLIDHDVMGPALHDNSLFVVSLFLPQTLQAGSRHELFARMRARAPEGKYMDMVIF